MEDDAQMVKRALARDAHACSALVEKLTPVLQSRVARVLLRKRTSGEPKPLRGDAVDLVQEMFVMLLERDGRVLRAWDPDRGLSLENFVGLVAEREVAAYLQSGRRSAWAELPSEEAFLQTSSDRSVATKARPPTPESHVETRQQLKLILERLRARLSPQGLVLFDALVVHELPVNEVAARYETTPAALYSFRHRLRAEVAAIRGELSATAARNKLTGLS